MLRSRSATLRPTWPVANVVARAVMLTTIHELTGIYELNGDLVRPCRIALSRFPHAAIEHQRRVPGRDVSRNHSTQSWFAQARTRLPWASSSATSPDAQVHGTCHSGAASTQR